MRDSKYEKLITAIRKDIEFGMEYLTKYAHVIQAVKETMFQGYDDKEYCVVFSEESTPDEVACTPVVGDIRIVLDEGLVKQYRKCSDNQKAYLNLLYDIREDEGRLYSKQYCTGHYAVVRR